MAAVVGIPHPRWDERPIAAPWKTTGGFWVRGGDGGRLGEEQPGQ